MILSIFGCLTIITHTSMACYLCIFGFTCVTWPTRNVLKLIFLIFVRFREKKNSEPGFNTMLVLVPTVGTKVGTNFPKNPKKFDFFQRNFFFKGNFFFSKVVNFSKKMISILTLSQKRKFRLKVGTNFGTTGWSWYQHSVVPCSELSSHIIL